MDSLDAVELVMDVEREFSIDLPDEEAERLARGTLGDLWRLAVRVRTGAEPPAGPPPAGDRTWRRIVRLVAARSGMPADDVRWDAPAFGDRPPGRSREGDS